MITITIVIICIAIFCAFSFGFLLRHFLLRTSSYVGVMKIIREDDKVIYSLELHEDPVMLEYKKEVVFKVETSDESSNRK